MACESVMPPPHGLIGILYLTVIVLLQEVISVPLPGNRPSDDHNSMVMISSRCSHDLKNSPPEVIVILNSPESDRCSPDL